MRTIVVTCAMVLLCLATWHVPAWADGGTVRVVERHGTYQIAVFTAPNPLRAGPVDVSVLVQDLGTGDPPARCATVITLTPADRVGPRIRVPATTEAATNKLLQSAKFVVPDAGRWHVDVTSTAGRNDVQARFTMTVAGAQPRWLSEWPWFGWPAVAVLMFVAHRRLAARRR